MAERPFIYRFTKDLRLDDHAGLAAAAARGPVLPVLVIDGSTEARLKSSPRRASFFCAAVAALDAELRERGSKLVVRRGKPGSTIAKLAATIDAAGVAWSASYDCAAMQSDRELQSELQERALSAAIVHDAPVIPPEESAEARSATGPGYRAFAPYFEIWWDLPIPSHEHPLLLRFAVSDVESEPLPSPHEFGAAGGMAAGPAVARRCFERFLREGAARYAAAANVPSEDRTSRLSAHLSFGTISARAIARAVRKRLSDPFALTEERLSLRLFLRALAHRDFFLQLSWFHPWTHDEPLQEKMRDIRVGALPSRARPLALRFHGLSARRRRDPPTACDGMDASARASRSGVVALLRHRRRLARRARRMGSLAHRRRSRACDGQLAMDRGRGRRHGAVSAHLQSRTATAPLRSGGCLRAAVGT